MSAKKISKKGYENFINGLTLKEIKIVSCSAEVKENFSTPANLKLTEHTKYVKKSGRFIAYIEYKLEGIKKGEKKKGFEVKVEYKVSYDTEIPITNEIFKIFSQTSLRLHTWPYFREIVNEMTIRMGLPPLVLDVLKVK